MKRWLAVVVASAALLASTSSGPEQDPIEEEEQNPGPPKRTDAGLELQIYSVRAVPGILEGTIASIDHKNAGLDETRAPDAGDSWLDALTPRTLTTTVSAQGASATANLEYQRPDAGHFRFIMSGTASAPNDHNAKAMAGFARLEIVVRDRGLTGVKATTQCAGTYGGTVAGTGGLKVVAGEIISGDTVCQYNWLSPTINSGTVTATSPSDETDGTDRKYATIYMDIGLAATSERFGDYDAGTGSANGTVDVFIEPQY